MTPATAGCWAALVDAADDARSILDQSGQAEPRRLHIHRRGVPRRVHAYRPLCGHVRWPAPLNLKERVDAAGDRMKNSAFDVADDWADLHRDDVGVAAGKRDAGPLRSRRPSDRRSAGKSRSDCGGPRIVRARSPRGGTRGSGFVRPHCSCIPTQPPPSRRRAPRRVPS